MPSPRDIKAGSAYIELTTRDLALVKGLRRAQARLHAFSAGVKDMGLRLVGLATAAAAPFAIGAKVYADFEQQLANVATMLDRPEEHLDTFRQALRRMSVEFGETTEALAGGLYDILSASIPAGDALGVLEVATRAAKAGLTDTRTAADAITTVLNAYGLSADHAATVSDLLFQVVRRGKTVFADLAPNIGKVATLAATAGISLEELGATIALLTRVGVRTENAMTAVTGVVTSFLKPAEEGAELARKLGFSLDTATLQAEGLAGIFQRIAHLKPEQIAELFPNVRALRGVLPALKNLEGFAEDVEAMRGRAGATQAAYDKMTQTLAHGFAQAKQAAVALFSVIGEAVSGSFKNFFEGVRFYLGLVKDWISNNQALVATIFKVVTIVGAIGVALVAVGVAGMGLSTVLGVIATAIGGVGTALGILGSIVGALLTPLGVVIGAVAALGLYLLHVTGAGGQALAWLGDRFAQLKDEAMATLKGIGDALAAGDLGLAARILWLALKLEWEKGVNFLKGLWLEFKNFFLRIATDAFYGTVGLLINAWSGLQVAWVETVTFLQNTWTRFTSLLRSAWNETHDWLAKRLTELWGLFDKDVDVKGIQGLIDQETRQMRVRIEQEKERAIAGREAERKSRREDIESEREAMLDVTAQLVREEDDARRMAYEDGINRSTEDLHKAREEWQAAIDAAAKARADKAIEGAPGKAEAPGEIPDLVGKLKDQLAGVATGLADALKFEVMGTFSSVALEGIGYGSSAADRTAKATEDTAKNTKRILGELQDGGAEFE